MANCNIYIFASNRLDSSLANFTEAISSINTYKNPHKSIFTRNQNSLTALVQSTIEFMIESATLLTLNGWTNLSIYCSRFRNNDFRVFGSRRTNRWVDEILITMSDFVGTKFTLRFREKKFSCVSMRFATASCNFWKNAVARCRVE